MIKSSDISVVVQGDICAQTQNCLKSIRRSLPNAEIILSTWNGVEVEELDYDKLILNEQPASFAYSSNPLERRNNVNLQIVSTVAGIKQAMKPYVFKIRTDFELSGSDFLTFFDICPKSDGKFRVFEHKLLNCCYFSRNPRAKKYVYPFHPSDIAIFGLRQDVLNFFDVPLMVEEEEFYISFKDCMCNKYVPEQHIFVNCLRKNGHTIPFEHQKHLATEIVDLTEHYFASNFIFLTWSQFNLVPPDKFSSMIDNNYESCLTPLEGGKLYQKYVDSNYSFSDFKEVEQHIQWLFMQAPLFKRIVKILTIPLCGRLKKNRNKIRANLLYWFQKVVIRDKARRL